MGIYCKSFLIFNSIWQHAQAMHTLEMLTAKMLNRMHTVTVQVTVTVTVASCFVCL